ncbi:MAG: serine protease [Lachnospiraceae bacterium]|nr:serine protease [Lachnospiraceae bacterium]
MEPIVMLGIGLLILGFVLICVEVVMPGFGAPGIGGIISLMVGIFLVSKTVEQGIMITIIVIVILAILVTVLFTLLQKRKLGSPIILEEEVLGGEKLESSDMDYLLQKRGVAVTDIRPMGKGDFDGIVLDVYSEKGYISKGENIIIVKIVQKKLIVHKL